MNGAAVTSKRQQHAHGHPLNPTPKPKHPPTYPLLAVPGAVAAEDLHQRRVVVLHCLPRLALMGGVGVGGRGGGGEDGGEHGAEKGGGLALWGGGQGSTDGRMDGQAEAAWLVVGGHSVIHVFVRPFLTCSHDTPGYVAMARSRSHGRRLLRLLPLPLNRWMQSNRLTTEGGRRPRAASPCCCCCPTLHLTPLRFKRRAVLLTQSAPRRVPPPRPAAPCCSLLPLRRSHQQQQQLQQSARPALCVASFVVGRLCACVCGCGGGGVHRAWAKGKEKWELAMGRRRGRGVWWAQPNRTSGRDGQAGQCMGPQAGKGRPAHWGGRPVLRVVARAAVCMHVGMHRRPRGLARSFQGVAGRA